MSVVPSLRSLDLTLKPSEHPSTYPGSLVERSCLVVGSWLYYLTPAPDISISQWDTQGDGGPLSLRGNTGLDPVLRAAGLTPMAGRYPVVAVGSNAAPAQLAAKYDSYEASHAIPITRARVSNLDVAHSAHVSKPGYVPFLPVATRSGVCVPLHILWLDPDQVRRMDETEPNYTRVVIGRCAATATLESGAELPAFALYRGRWGALRLAPGTEPESLRATSQATVFALLAEHAWFRNLVPEVQGGVERATAALSGDEERRNRIRQELASRDLAASDALSVDMVGPGEGE